MRGKCAAQHHERSQATVERKQSRSEISLQPYPFNRTHHPDRWNYHVQRHYRIYLKPPHDQALRFHCDIRSEEIMSELQSLMRISYAFFCFQNQLIVYYTTL